MTTEHIQHPAPEPEFPHYLYVTTTHTYYAAQMAVIGYERATERSDGEGLAAAIIYSTPDPIDPNASRIYSVYVKHLR